MITYGRPAAIHRAIRQWTDRKTLKNAMISTGISQMDRKATADTPIILPLSAPVCRLFFASHFIEDGTIHEFIVKLQDRWSSTNSAHSYRKANTSAVPLSIGPKMLAILVCCSAMGTIAVRAM